MKKDKLSKKNQEKFKWLMNADTINEDVEVKDGILIWKYGVWKSGFWEGGTWEGGFWKDGTWKSGFWKSGTWEGGVWEG